MTKKLKVTKGRPDMAPVYVSRATHRKLKVHAVNIGRTMTALLEEAVNYITRK